jgi:hypothetical protein
VTSGIQALVILVIALALGVHVHEGALGWLVVLVAAMVVTMPFAALSQGIALLTRREATMIAVANFIGLPLLIPVVDAAGDEPDAVLDAGGDAVQPAELGSDRRP